VERAYARDDALEQRREVMAAWAMFIAMGEAKTPTSAIRRSS
jgi:hypothetical protein